ncbi:uncharacterized protein FOMMEDRAFT_159535 [Fomitiporia mediterranea MF3/22]|uniref:uncharacterized protein n=1 Tax=Fomitiporia mediterranea (strain MF3/22) TaxID=694068 RepID=UPI0004407A03|nr:uncharacterized protein FOMMEDRAFT_159535 [Fomitiporia mediterranea MF3/22]EJC99958.1 hypothetical protein FOMMEDRAFT_159535 [Fomitiporia mediterranea MF3/22]
MEYLAGLVFYYRVSVDLGYKHRKRFLQSVQREELDMPIHIRYMRTENLEEAIEHHRAALELFPDGHPECSNYLNHLGNALEIRFHEYFDSTTILIILGLGDSELSPSLRNFASSLLFYSRDMGSSTLLKRACSYLTVLPSMSFLAWYPSRICLLNSCLARSQAHHIASRAYRSAVLLLHRAVIDSPDLQTQHGFLKEKSDYRIITLDIVAYTVQIGLKRLTALNRLAETNRESADRFKDVSWQPGNLATSSTLPQSDSVVVRIGSSVLDVHKGRKIFGERLKLKKQLSSDQGHIINEMRQIPGFEGFLTSTVFHRFALSYQLTLSCTIPPSILSKIS